MSADLLIEIGTEELPPKSLKILAYAFLHNVREGLKKAGIENEAYKFFATPRRLAVLLKNVPESQPDRNIERKGPNLKAAYDTEGKPTKALEGFARSCGASVDQLEQQETDKGVWLVFKANEKGQLLSTLIEEIVSQSLAKLPIPKRMRWGSSDTEFVRPVHWLVILHGSNIIDAQVLGVKSSNVTHGHRFHTEGDIVLSSTDDYVDALRKGYVIADFEERADVIRQQVEKAADQLKGVAVIDIDLLNEVTALNEWPIAVAGEFEEEYLSVPAEALIKTMQDNQKYFPVVDKKGELKNYFITISNIDSKTPEKVKEGNERVVRPRLADAKFFWEQDQKQSLESFGESLASVVFQTKLGTVAEKTERVMALSTQIAEMTGANGEYAKRAALLSKCDLQTNMVGEFASLQGVMGKHYAQIGGEPEAVAIAINEQYMPRRASDDTATTAVGQVLAIADKLDTLVGIFAIGQKPTGEKDPYALRRAALGILRTIIERELDIDLTVIIAQSAKLLNDKVDAGKVENEVFEFMIERLRAYYLDRDVLVDVFDAVSALQPSRPLDFNKRIKAVSAFRALPEAESLAAANKRVGNILKKSKVTAENKISKDLFEEAAEKTLYDELGLLSAAVEPLFTDGDYEAALRQLSSLRKPVDDFFDSVMVMTDDEKIKNNRIALLNQMSSLFLRVADMSRLHQK